MPGAGPAAQQSPSGVGTGHVNLQTFLGLNREAGERMAGGVGQGLARSSISGERYGPQADQTRGEHAARVGLAQGGGVGTLLQDQYGRGGGYSSGMRGFDAFLTRGAGGNTIDDAARRNGSWLGYVMPPQAPRTGPGRYVDANGGTGYSQDGEWVGRGPGSMVAPPPSMPGPAMPGGQGATDEDLRRRGLL